MLFMEIMTDAPVSPHGNNGHHIDEEDRFYNALVPWSCVKNRSSHWHNKQIMLITGERKEKRLLFGTCFYPKNDAVLFAKYSPTNF